MDWAHALPDDELALARLASAKLAKVMRGLLTVGLAALETERPLDFLEGRQQTPLGFLEVLACVGVRPGHADKIAPLRQFAKDLASLTRETHARLVELAAWRSMPPAAVRATAERLGDSYARFFQALGELRSVLGENTDYLAQVRQDLTGLHALFPSIAA